MRDQGTEGGGFELGPGSIVHGMLLLGWVYSAARASPSRPAVVFGDHHVDHRAQRLRPVGAGGQRFFVDGELAMRTGAAGGDGPRVRDLGHAVEALGVLGPPAR